MRRRPGRWQKRRLRRRCKKANRYPSVRLDLRASERYRRRVRARLQKHKGGDGRRRMRGFERHHPGVVQTKQVAELGTVRSIVDINDGKRENIYVSDDVHETITVDAKENTRRQSRAIHMRGKNRDVRSIEMQSHLFSQLAHDRVEFAPAVLAATHASAGQRHLPRPPVHRVRRAQNEEHLELDRRWCWCGCCGS